MRISEVDFSTPLKGVDVLRSVKSHYDDAGYETKMWTYGSGNRAKLKVWKKYPTPAGSPVSGVKKVEVTIGFSESLLYCCRISLEGQRFRLISQRVWRQQFLPKPAVKIVDIVNSAFKIYEERREREDRQEQEQRQNVIALAKRGITAIPCPVNVYHLRVKFGDHNHIDFTIDWNSLQSTIKNVELAFPLTVEQFQDLIRSIALTSGQNIPLPTVPKARRRIMVDKSHVVKRKAKCEGRYL